MTGNKNSLLFQKGTIGELNLKNRIIMAPMGVKSEPDGGVSPREIRYYEERAMGGCGMIITGRFATTEKYEMRSHHLLTDYHHVGRLGLLAEKVHHYGTKLCVQIGPGLGRIVHQDPFTPPYSASAVSSFWYPELMCRPYEIEDIQYLAWSVGYAASLARTAGADAVELHAYGDYLLDQFMTPLYNKRTDQYGGSLANRMRFSMECIDEIQKQCGENFPVIVKYTPYHGIPGGRELEEGIEMARMFEDAGVQALHVDMGCYERWYDQINTVYDKPGLQIQMAEKITEAVSIPVIAHGKLNDPDLAEQVLKEQKADFIALAHQMLADPHWPEKVKAGKGSEIRPCIGCNECLYQSHLGKEYSCAVNPQTLREGDYPLELPDERKCVLVIGGGPGGMAAAIAAAEQGHVVELWEQQEKMGGMLLAAGAPVFKQDMLRYVEYLTRRIERLPINVCLNKKAQAEKVIPGKFDHVILACGAKPFVPPIPGADSSHVLEAVSLLQNGGTVGEHAVIIGGGLVGCETAVHVSKQAKTVTILEMQPEILYRVPHPRNNDQKLKQMLKDAAVKAVTGVCVKEILEDKVTFQQGNDIKAIPCDTVIIAAGFKTDPMLEEELEQAGISVQSIGDAVKPRKVYDAVHEGFHAARLLDRLC